ncbi:hypothetical protein ACH41H_45550 [Streptomyces sp. NPDC020800]|uniref:hypothetical protein n=1 Tax=Streptomyces sp. NPDC020800 TaxID=3365092 RepID=UPI00378D5920
MLDWFIRHHPESAHAYIGEITRAAHDRWQIPAQETLRTLRQAVSLEGKLNEEAREAFFALLTPAGEDRLTLTAEEQGMAGGSAGGAPNSAATGLGHPDQYRPIRLRHAAKGNPATITSSETITERELQSLFGLRATRETPDQVHTP